MTKEISNIESFPLQWPLGHPRTEKTRESLFNKYTLTLVKARDGVLEELNKWKAKNVIISSNAPSKKDGTPYATFPKPTDAGVAVYFTLNNELRVIPCDEYNSIEENLQALKYVIESLRTIERHGGRQVFNTAFGGFKALPEVGSARRWWEILDVPQNANANQINNAYKAKMWSAHPDRGGSTDKVAELTEARKQGLEQLNNK